VTKHELQYQTGFGGHFETEAVPGALPKGRNSPQRPAFGLYAEQLSGSAFTAPRHENRRSWLYRMRPTADHRPYQRYEAQAVRARPGGTVRWHPTGCAGIRPPTFPPMRFRRRHGHDDCQPRSVGLSGVAIHLYRATSR
jgi:homogentisate 1,2-dioxygenase